jgi:hypothetical protein
MEVEPNDFFPARVIGRNAPYLILAKEERPEEEKRAWAGVLDWD